MAKVRRNHTTAQAIVAITTAIRLEASRIAGEKMDMKVYKTAMHGLTNIIDDSGLMTLAENADDAIELQHQIVADLGAQLTAERAAEWAATQEQEAEEKTEQEQAQEQETEQGEQEQGTEQKTEQKQAQEQETKPAKIADKTGDIPY